MVILFLNTLVLTPRQIWVNPKFALKCVADWVKVYLCPRFMWPLLASVCVTSDLIRLIVSEKVIVPCAHSHMSSVALFLQSGDSLKGEIVKSVYLSSDPMKCG